MINNYKTSVVKLGIEIIICSILAVMAFLMFPKASPEIKTQREVEKRINGFALQDETPLKNIMGQHISEEELLGNWRCLVTDSTRANREHSSFNFIKDSDCIYKVNFTYGSCPDWEGKSLRYGFFLQERGIIILDKPVCLQPYTKPFQVLVVIKRNNTILLNALVNDKNNLSRAYLFTNERDEMKGGNGKEKTIFR